LGDCWLIGALSVLATQPNYIKGRFKLTTETKDLTDDEAEGMQEGLYCPMFHFLAKYGIYVIRFFKEYGWRYVIIDDKLPCYKKEEDSTSTPDLVFGKCRSHSEFWVPLIEKAYAKIHNCYEALIAGYLDDALMDLTGLLPYKYKLKGPKPQFGTPDDLWKVLVKSTKSKSMLGCSVTGNPGETEHEVTIDDEPVGILKSHAYGIIDVFELPDPKANNAHKSHRLLRVRNPWGTKEWNGKWSDGSPKLLAHLEEYFYFLLFIF
jgi:calpain